MKSSTDHHVSSEKKAEVQNDLQALSMRELLEKLESSPQGLTQKEAEKRLAQYGTNEIKEKKRNFFLKFLPYLWKKSMINF